MRVFLAVMREGSTLAASRSLGINQTTVARRINALEHALGFTLFEKTTRGANPTVAATNLMPFAETLESAASAFEAEAAAEKGRASGPIRITAFESDIYTNIGTVVADFIEENPAAAFEFIASERFLDLIKGEADIALRATPAITDDRLIAQKVGHTQWTYYASRTYADKRELPKEYSKDMEDHCVLLLNHIPSNRKNLVRCASANDMLMAIRAGQGIGPIPVVFGDKLPDLVRCFDPPSGSDLPLWLVTSPEAHKRPEVRRFTAFAAPRIAQYLKGTDQ